MLAPLSSRVGETPVSRAAPPPALFEHLLLALSNAALACFLAGYQVHEKSVLLPLLPMQVSSAACYIAFGAA
jgi:hypothetical protein